MNNLTKFPNWPAVLAHVAADGPLWYHAPLDPRPVRVGAVPYGKQGLRLRAADGSGFNTDEKHLDRFLRADAPPTRWAVAFYLKIPGAEPLLCRPDSVPDRAAAVARLRQLATVETVDDISAVEVGADGLTVDGGGSLSVHYRGAPDARHALLRPDEGADPGADVYDNRTNAYVPYVPS